LGTNEKDGWVKEIIRRNPTQALTVLELVMIARLVSIYCVSNGIHEIAKLLFILRK